MAMIEFYGGKLCDNLNETCTHAISCVFDSNTKSFDANNTFNVKIVTPDWILDCISTNQLISELKYNPKHLVTPKMTIIKGKSSPGNKINLNESITKPVTIPRILTLKTKPALKKHAVNSEIYKLVQSNSFKKLQLKEDDKQAFSHEPNLDLKGEIGVDFLVGSFLEAKDLKTNSWYKAKIVELKLNENKVKIHFHGWNSRYDQYYLIKSDIENLRPLRKDEISLNLN